MLLDSKLPKRKRGNDCRNIRRRRAAHPEVVRASAVLHIEPVTGDHRIFRIVWLGSIIRGAGRATMTAIIEAADRHGVTLQLTAQPQRPIGDGKQMTPSELEAFYNGFGFVVTTRGQRFSIVTRQYIEGSAQMERNPR